MVKDSFRVNTGVKRIEVNDDGEYITLNLGDQSFFSRLSAIIDNFNARLPEYEKTAKELDALHKTMDEIKQFSGESDSEKYKKTFAQFERARDLAKLNEQVHRDIMKEIDNAFRDDVCRKVFGDIVPAMDMFSDFFEQLSPYIEKFAAERTSKASKYSPSRTGNA